MYPHGIDEEHGVGGTVLGNIFSFIVSSKDKAINYSLPVKKIGHMYKILDDLKNVYYENAIIEVTATQVGLDTIFQRFSGKPTKQHDILGRNPATAQKQQQEAAQAMQ